MTTATKTVITMNGEQMKQIKDVIKNFKLTRASADFQRFIKFTVLKDTFSVEICNFDNHVKLTFENEMYQDQFSFLVPIEAIKKLKGIKKTSCYQFEVLDVNQISFIDNGIKTMLYTMNVEDYPNNHNFNNSNTIELYKGYLQGLKNNLSFVSNKETRPILQGVCHSEKNLVSTDSHQLLKTTNLHSLDAEKITVAGTTAKIVTDIFKAEEGLEVFYNDNKIKYKTLNIEVVGKLLDGNYPETKNMMPDYSKSEIKINVDQLLNVMEQVKNIGQHVVNLKTDKENNLVHLIAVSPEKGKLETSIPCKIEGEEIKLAFNALNVLNVLNQNKKDKLIFKFNGSMSPFTATNENNDNKTYLFAPVRSY